MKLISRILSLIVALQMLCSCNQYGLEIITPAAKVVAPMVEISGSVASVLKHASQILIPTAMATDGEMVIWDLSEPDYPVEVHRARILKASFTLSVEKSKIANRPIQLSYIDDSSSLSRDMILLAPDSEAIRTDLDIDSTVKVKLLQDSIAQRQNRTYDFKRGLREIERLRINFSQIGVDTGIVNITRVLDTLLVSSDRDVSSQAASLIMKYLNTLKQLTVSELDERTEEVDPSEIQSSILSELLTLADSQGILLMYQLETCSIEGACHAVKEEDRRGL